MKTQEQENFPVASRLFRSDLRDVITLYYNFARTCDDIADSKNLSRKDKISKLYDAENSLFNKGKNKQAKALRELFIKEKLDFSLATDLLIAFKRDAENTHYKTWAQLLDYCKYSAEPVGRFMLAIHDENPSTYLPAAALCAVLQLTNHIQDLHDDVCILNRIYLPDELLKKHRVSKKSLYASKSTKSLQNLINDVLNRSTALLKDARVLPSIVKNKRLKLYLCITLSLTDILLNKLYNNDVLMYKVKLSKVDWIKAFIIGLYTMIKTKRKTLTIEGQL
jgi:squalene synthase HpnC